MIYQIPNVDSLLYDPPNDDPFNILHLVHHTLRKMRSSYEVINISNLIKDSFPKDSKQIMNLTTSISTCNHSVLNFIMHCLDTTKLSFIRSGQIYRFIEIDVTQPFSQSLHGVDPTTFKEYVLMMTKSTYAKTIFPWQIQMRYKNCITTLVLKCIIANPPNHFQSFVRIGFEERLIKIDDQFVTFHDINEVKRACIGLYIVFQQVTDL